LILLALYESMDTESIGYLWLAILYSVKTKKTAFYWYTDWQYSSKIIFRASRTICFSSQTSSSCYCFCFIFENWIY
jgi:hypothetical protein